MTDTIAKEVAALIARELKVDPSKISPETLLFEGGLELDSFATVELIGLIESAFGIQFSDADFHPDTFYSVGTLSRVVARYKAA